MSKLGKWDLEELLSRLCEEVEMFRDYLGSVKELKNQAKESGVRVEDYFLKEILGVREGSKAMDGEGRFVRE